MYDTDRDIVSLSPHARRLIFGGVRKKYDLLFGDEAQQLQEAFDLLDEVAYQEFGNIRRDLTAPTFQYDGDLLQNMDGTSANPVRHWAALPPHEYQQRWQSEFRMTEDMFDKLFAIVEPHFAVVGHSRHNAFR